MRSLASEMAADTKPSMAANKNLPGDGFNVPRTPPLEMVDAPAANAGRLFNCLLRSKT